VCKKCPLLFGPSADGFLLENLGVVPDARKAVIQPLLNFFHRAVQSRAENADRGCKATWFVEFGVSAMAAEARVGWNNPLLFRQLFSLLRLGTSPM
jgi:hypothetical protein